LILPDADPYEAFLHRRLLAAGRVLAADPAVTEQQAGEVTRQLFDLMMDTRVDPLAHEIGAILRDLMRTPLRDVLVRRAQPHAHARAGLRLRWLGYLAADAGLRYTLCALLTAEEWKTRQGAAQALGLVARYGTVRQALLVQIDDPDDDVQIAVVDALAGAAAHPTVRDALVRKLNAMMHVRDTASWSLHPLGMDPELEQSLVDLLLDPARPWIVGLLNVIGVHHQPCDSCPLGPGNSAAVVQAVRQLLTDPRLLVRLGAAPVLLAASGSAAGVGADGRDALLALLRDPPADEGTRRPVSKAFARGEAAHWLVPWVRDPIVREGLLEMLVRDLDEDNRCTLARELEDAASDPVVAQALLQLLADPSAKVQRNAVVGLRGATADAKVRQALLACAGPDRDLEMRSAAVGALDRVADDPVVRAMLLDLLRAPDPELRRAAVTALSGQTADRGVRSALLPCLRDPEDETRSAAVTALRAVVADRGVQEALLWNLDDEYTRRRPWKR
jgi:hypothetical protein